MSEYIKSLAKTGTPIEVISRVTGFACFEIIRFLIKEKLHDEYIARVYSNMKV